jgi:hypothetical protein
VGRPRPFKVEWETALLRGSRLPLPVCAVLLAFATYADADGTSIRVSQSRVAEGLGATERTVRKWLGVGRDAGWIERTRESVGTGSADHYRLTIPEQTTGTSVPVLGADHRNDRAEVPERTRTTTGRNAHDQRNDRSAYQPSTNSVTNPEDQPIQEEVELTPEHKGQAAEVWNEVERQAASEAAAKAARREPLSFIEREALEKRQEALSLVPSFDD